MKRSAILFLVLLSVFTGAWVYKTRNPISRPANATTDMSAGNYWWEAVKPEEVSSNWKLSAGVPDNYIPVPGMTDVYMVVDEEGYITGYKKGEKDEAGQWKWEDTNPDIPENYQPVPGMKDVYKVAADDGSVKYYKYVRNADDTYAFVEVDARGNILGMEEPKGNEIPENYERINRNQYAVKNNNGVTIAYKEKVPDSSSDNGYVWVNIDEPTTTNEDLALPDVGFDLTKDVTGKGDVTGGTKLREGFNGVAASDSGDPSAVPTLMPQLVIPENQQASAGGFVFTNPQVSTSTTTNETYFITAPPDLNVSTQVITIAQNQGGGYQFSGNMAPDDYSQAGALPTVNPSFLDTSYTMPSTSGGNNLPGVSNSSMGTFVSQETTYSTKTEGNERVTYATTVKNTYDASGNLIGTEKGNPTVVSREKISASAAASSSISGNLGDEYNRMVDIFTSAGGKFVADVPNSMAFLLNNERAQSGLSPVDFTGTSNAYKMAICRAAMMALTGSGSKNVSGYGDLSSMCARYGVGTSSPSENILVVNAGTSAETVHAAFQNSARSSRMSSAYTQIAIVVAQYGGKYYVDEIFIK